MKNLYEGFRFWGYVQEECRIWAAIWHHQPETQKQLDHRHHFIIAGLRGRYGLHW